MTERTEAQMQRDFDRVQAMAFMGDNAAFFGTILCSMKFHWTKSPTEINTAATDGKNLYWNEDFFYSLSPETRRTVLMHELWHPGLLHMARRGSRDPRTWNAACDYYINNQLDDMGYSFVGLEFGCLDRFCGTNYRGWTEEDIYNDLAKNPEKIPKNFDLDIMPCSSDLIVEVTNTVVQAMQSHAMAGGKPGNLPGNMSEVITQFLKPVVRWEALLERFMTELLDEDYTWARPNRRFQDIYLPSRFTDDGRLEHLAYFQDVSGSISTKDSLCFNSELAHVWQRFKPEKMSIVQFDTVIQKEDELKEGDTFTEIEIIGRGGTCLNPVRDWIIKHKPTAAIIFSDLEVAPMQPLPIDIPVIWICVGNGQATVPFGQLIHIRS